ncbi:MAG: hypothetical protein HQL87_16655 [Magnetococcales bacterium]|nr:hypothetical protein [Magnetococcales bacterium]
MPSRLFPAFSAEGMACQTGGCRRLLVLILVLLAWLPAACGYRFPGDMAETDGRWQHATVQITGKGATDKPQLAFALRDRLQARLGFNGPVGGQEKRVVLKIILEPVQRSLLTVDSAGLANLFQITIHAKPMVEGDKSLPTYPAVHGTATYYEPVISTSVQATQRRAETEAMEQLTDTLIALLSSSFQPNP